MPVSHPSRGAWIEIRFHVAVMVSSSCRTPHGVRGLKCLALAMPDELAQRRTPHGVRGLKSVMP